MPFKMWFQHQFVTVFDWMAGVAGLLVAAGLTAYWFLPVGRSCSTSSGITSCQSVNPAGAGGSITILLTPLVIAVALAAAALFVHCHRSRLMLLAFGIAAVMVFVVSFGLDGPLMPAALVSLAAALVPQRNHRV